MDRTAGPAHPIPTPVESTWDVALRAAIPGFVASLLLRTSDAWSALWWLGALLGVVAVAVAVVSLDRIRRAPSRRWLAVVPVLMVAVVVQRFVQSL